MTERTPAIAALLGVIGVVFVLEFVLALQNADANRILFGSFPGIVTWSMGSLTVPGVRHNGEPWRLFTCLFLHANLIHFLFNSSALLQLGRLSESIFGSWRTVVVYFLAGLGSSTASLTRFALHYDGGGSSVGASGAVCGLLGLLIAHLKGREDAGSQMVRQSLVRWAVFIAIFSLMPSIDWAGHLGGFVVGYGLGHVLPSGHFTQLKKGWRRWWCTAAGLGLSGVAAIALVWGGSGALDRHDTMDAGERIVAASYQLGSSSNPRETLKTLKLSVPVIEPTERLEAAHQKLLDAMNAVESDPSRARAIAEEANELAVEAIRSLRPDLYRKRPR